MKKILFTGLTPEEFRFKKEVVHVPLIKIIKPGSWITVDNELDRICKYDWLIFTSRFAAAFILKRFAGRKNRAGKFPKICAIGSATAKTITKMGYRVDLIPAIESSRGIVGEFGKKIKPGKNILIPRSNLADDYLPKKLSDLGHRVRAVTAYINIPRRPRRVDFSEIDEVFFTSPSTVRNFFRFFGYVQKIKYRFIGRTTREAFYESRANTGAAAQ